MTIDEFLLELAVTPNHWYILKERGREVIRSGNSFMEFCPLTAVASQAQHKVFHLCQFPEAADVIGIDYDTSMTIAITADHRQDDERYSEEIRQQLLQTIHFESLSI